jgi:hypothetical protein
VEGKLSGYMTAYASVVVIVCAEIQTASNSMHRYSSSAFGLAVVVMAVMEVVERALDAARRLEGKVT